jgi:hypothetical protein
MFEVGGCWAKPCDYNCAAMMMERGVWVGSGGVGDVFFSVWTVQYPMFVNIRNMLPLHFMSLCLSGVTTCNEENDRSISYFTALIH